MIPVIIAYVVYQMIEPKEDAHFVRIYGWLCDRLQVRISLMRRENFEI